MDLNWDISADSRLANFPNYMNWFLIISFILRRIFIYSAKKKKKKDHIFWKKLLDAYPISILSLFLVAEHQFIQGSSMLNKKTISSFLGQLGLVMWLNLGDRIQQSLLVV